MKLTIAFTAVLAAFLPSAFATTLGYDLFYSDGDNSLTGVACSDGKNGLMTRGFTTIGSLPSFPYVASTDSIAGWNSTQCGKCWKITYIDGQNKPHFITVTAIDHADSGFYTTQKAMDELTGGHAVEFGVVDVTVQPVNPANCGL
ncbi:Cerato-platanin [Collybia nuda]|uniref:Cerato-platanin n=1 Tax=Collybia nuda TaxID=64659 RepID=A0A9P5Y058_9AGAR|nr:Cerato-platanin [Collybia nuda]